MKFYVNLTAAVAIAFILLGCASSRANVYRKPVPGTFKKGAWNGIASWYGREFHGRRTASGELFNMYEYTAAHRTLPFGTHVRVTNRQTGHSTTVRINDRGPFVRGREIDLSYVAAREIGILEKGLEVVRLEVLSN